MKPDESTPFEGVETVASSTESTGLMPTLPKDDEEDVQCAALYAIHDARGARRKLFRMKRHQ